MTAPTSTTMSSTVFDAMSSVTERVVANASTTSTHRLVSDLIALLPLLATFNNDSVTTASTLSTSATPTIATVSTTSTSPTQPHLLHTFDGLIIAKFNSTASLQQNDIIYSPLCTVLFTLAYSAILLGGLLGNALVCYVVVRNRAMQTVTNIFITNLAVSDLLMCLLCVPFTPIYLYARYWPFGMIMCHTVAFAQTSSVYISTFTLTAIAFDRYLVIMHPFRQRMRMRHCLLIVVGVWALSLVLASPFGYYQHEVESNISGTPSLYCEENWMEGQRRLFASGTTVIQFVVPFVIIAYCYTRVSLRLLRRARQRPGHHRCGPQAGRKDELDRERKRRTNRMLVYMVLVFGAAWLPLNVVNMLNDWIVVVADEVDYYNALFIVAHLAAMSSTCYNPVLYAWKNDNFRKEFKLVLPCYGRTAADGGGLKGGLLAAAGAEGMGMNGGGCGGGGVTGVGDTGAVTGGGRWLQTSGLTMTGTLDTTTNAGSQPVFADGGVYVGGGCGGGGQSGRGSSGSVSVGALASAAAAAVADSEDPIRLSDIAPPSQAGDETARTAHTWRPRSNGHPETHRLPSGVLETNFEGPGEGNGNIRFDERAPMAALSLAKRSNGATALLQ